MATGAGIRLASNVISGFFQNSAENNRAIHLKEAKAIEAHVKLAEIHQKDNVVKLERLIVFWCIVVAFCYDTVFNNTASGTGMVLVERNIGFISNLFMSAKEGTVQVDLHAFKYQLFHNLVAMVVGSYLVGPRK